MKMSPKYQKLTIEVFIAIIGGLVLWSCFEYLKDCNKEFEELTGIIRVVVALATAAVSIVLPDVIELETFLRDGKQDSLWPKIKAGGALAVFVLVYLFNPI